MRPKNSAQQQINCGDPRRRGVHKLDAALEAEPKSEAGLLPVPARLVGEAKRLYRQYAECLDTMNLAQKPDREALACACVNLATAAKADRMLRRQGEVVQIPLLGGPRGKRRVIAHKQQKNRWWSVKVEAERQFARFAGNFGLTGPSSRAGMEAQVVTADDDRKFWELLSKPRPKGEDANREPTQ